MIRARSVDQVLQLASASNPSAAMLAQSKQIFGVDLKQGLLQYLNGEITFELDDPAPVPAWKAIFGEAIPDQCRYVGAPFTVREYASGAVGGRRRHSRRGEWSFAKILSLLLRVC